jgi:hypothetical protein
MPPVGSTVGTCDARHPLHNPAAAEGGATLSRIWMELRLAQQILSRRGERKSFCSAFRHGELSTSSQTSNRARTSCHDTTAPRPGRSTGRAPAGTTEWGLRLPSGPRSVSRSLRRTGLPSGSLGHGGGNRGPDAVAPNALPPCAPHPATRARPARAPVRRRRGRCGGSC